MLIRSPPGISMVVGPHSGDSNDRSRVSQKLDLVTLMCAWVPQMLPVSAKMGSSWTQFDIWILLAMFTDAPQAISIFPDARRMLHSSNPDEVRNLRMFSDPTPQYLILINTYPCPRARSHGWGQSAARCSQDGVTMCHQDSSKSFRDVHILSLIHI